MPFLTICRNTKVMHIIILTHTHTHTHTHARTHAHAGTHKLSYVANMCGQFTKSITQYKSIEILSETDRKTTGQPQKASKNIVTRQGNKETTIYIYQLRGLSHHLTELKTS